jgi:hypothetical protein
MESFILGSEWDLIFLLCFVSQTIQNISEILNFKKTYLFKMLKKNHQNWPHIWKVSFWDLNAENLVHLTWNDPNAKTNEVLEPITFIVPHPHV